MSKFDGMSVKYGKRSEIYFFWSRIKYVPLVFFSSSYNFSASLKWKFNEFSAAISGWVNGMPNHRFTVTVKYSLQVKNWPLSNLEGPSSSMTKSYLIPFRFSKLFSMFNSRLFTFSWSKQSFGIESFHFLNSGVFIYRLIWWKSIF